MSVCLTDGGGLLIRNTSRSHSGAYQCFVSNVAGTVSALATVVVRDVTSHGRCPTAVCFYSTCHFSQCQ